MAQPDYPDWVKNKLQYKNYLRESKKLLKLKDKHKRVKLSTKDHININLPKGKLVAELKKIGITEGEEFNDIIAINKAIYSLQGTVNVLKQTSKYKRGQKPNYMDQKNMLDEYKEEIIGMFIDFKTKAEIKEELNEKHGLKLEYFHINNFFYNNKKDIDRQREIRIKSWDDLPLSTKRGRLEKLEYLYNKIMDEMKTAKRQVKLGYSRELRGILEQIRKEVEGETIRFDIHGKLDIDITLTDYVSDQSNKLLILQMVLAKVGVKQRINPLYLMYKLQNSWYAKHAGFGNAINQEVNNYPSQIIYDIADAHTKFLTEPDIVDAEIIQDDSKPKVKVRRAKERLLEILAKNNQKQ